MERTSTYRYIHEYALNESENSVQSQINDGKININKFSGFFGMEIDE